MGPHWDTPTEAPSASMFARNMRRFCKVLRTGVRDHPFPIKQRPDKLLSDKRVFRHPAILAAGRTSESRRQGLSTVITRYPNMALQASSASEKDLKGEPPTLMAHRFA